MLKKVAIIDPVGVKAGMNYYDMSLLRALSQKDVATFLYSNLQDGVAEVTVKKFYGIFYKSKIKQGLNLLSATLKSCADCKKNGVEVVLLHLFSTQLMSFIVFLICKLFGLKVIAIAHDVSSFVGDDNRFFRNLIYNHFSDNIVVHNSFSLDYLLPLLNTKTVNNISVIKHGSFTDMPNDAISKSQARQQLGLNEKGKYLLFFGQIKKVKRLDVLLEAMKDVQENIKLIVAGKVWKDDFSVYQNIIDKHQLGNRVQLDIQFISNDKKELYFKASDVMVLPYEKIFQSGVLLTAMSYGMVSISSDIPAFRDVVDDNIDGFLFEKNDSQKLAKKINDVASNESRLNAVGDSARVKMLNVYSWDKIAGDYLAII